MRYDVIWNQVQLFGDYNTQVRVAYECVIVTKKLCEIPYHTVTHWNSVIKPYLHIYLLLSVAPFSHTSVNDN